MKLDLKGIFPPLPTAFNEATPFFPTEFGFFGSKPSPRPFL